MQACEVGCLFWRAQGEGEVKIVSRLLRPWADVQPEDSHAIIASDSDMVLMALMTPLPNLFVLAEPTLTRRAAISYA
jgi:5'-3' exonuclease